MIYYSDLKEIFNFFNKNGYILSVNQTSFGWSLPGGPLLFILNVKGITCYMGRFIILPRTAETTMYNSGLYMYDVIDKAQLFNYIISTKKEYQQLVKSYKLIEIKKRKEIIEQDFEE